MHFKGKKILVLGAGISGISVACVLQNRGAQVTLSDSKSAELLKNKDLSAIHQCGVTLALGQQGEELLQDIDYIVLSPGISIEIPLVKIAKAKNITVMSEIEVAYQLCTAPIVAITGTNGKTTTTTLIGEMVKTTDRNVVVGGNIGLALSQEVAEVGENGIVVAEISSFQLEGSIHFRPRVAAILNITPDHLDRHHSLENYIAMKERIFANQTKDDYIVLNYDDIIVREMANKVPSKVFFFSRKVELDSGIFVKDGMIIIRWQEKTYIVCPISKIQLRGGHNIENVLAACGVAFFAGVTLISMVQTLFNFTGVEHRIEKVTVVNGVPYYNDSKATNPESSIKALEAFEEPIILIAGGRDKNTDLTAFMKLIKEKVEHLILLGEAQERFEAAAFQHDVSQIHNVNSLSEAVQLAYHLAKEPQVVLLSPACASYDMFTSYEERGKVFKRLVYEL
ncbi:MULTISPECIES: UDP-N-acetylmuramoyl-L-alanine--D-glutamate ligase [Pelosinus]|uniref:UDP-N-acetylmuramoylalanine--D-glutamate ligase n=1 Tax=Pelosinus fermentans B4 TaxID=1149862 RepID=I9AZ26_9FIRM|nr:MULTISPECIES: UDP-N-acetylmuramoyl-L-alanine--D-glutamate ligase [Pelosinus]EIW18152.1 UDP-N-acetylmuramoylalanine/D-glutamate ligase [Pelosinus fermentans B4]EIW24189.1 UDP-N-acetylmuramoylalanine--D-glutamate ligase [Pelosinus fermentans A11]OAM94116.1 UDP-N-acetylmuramoylalanine--D-glutamate ligase [Pelosinus fermentans DSM 17108]SDR00338.1 UDP-N-acetylmuramoylalanine--D-glutamate ligase [Pelosinus fermentans]